MSHRRLQFGHKETADIQLRFINPDGTDYAADPLFLHTQVLKKYDFFEAMLSDRWSSGPRPLQLRLTNSDNFDTYVKCLQLLYLSEAEKRLSFTRVEETLGVLEIASELMLKDCVDACMHYLQAVRWTSEENVQIRALVAALQLHPSPDLAARLGVSECGAACEHVKVMEEILGELLYLVSNGAPPRTLEITERIILANLDVNSPRALADVTMLALLKEILNNIDALKIQLRSLGQIYYGNNAEKFTVVSFALQWLLRPMLSLQVFETAVATFAEEHDLAQVLLNSPPRHPFIATLLDILVTMLHSLGNGVVICSRSVRLSFLTTWLPVIQKLTNDRRNNEVKFPANLVEGLRDVIETLPLIDQKQIYKAWINACLKPSKANPDLSMSFESWYNNLRQVHHQTEVSIKSDASKTSTEDCIQTPPLKKHRLES
eukprot:Gb_33960 [translate_table: standard]